jgi:hypothetical protein
MTDDPIYVETASKQTMPRTPTSALMTCAW